MSSLLIVALSSIISAGPIDERPADGLCYWHCLDYVFATRGENHNVAYRAAASGDIKANLLSVDRFAEVVPVMTFEDAVLETNNGNRVIATLKLERGLHAVVMEGASAGMVT